MENKKDIRSSKQVFFQEMVLGTLVYAVVLGIFEDYTDILTTWSYSTTFFVAVVMQILTFATFKLKSRIAKRFKGKQGKKYSVALVFSIWLVMFFSKFIFLAVIDFIFRESAELTGFVGLIAIMFTMFLVKKLIDIVYKQLA